MFVVLAAWFAGATLLLWRFAPAASRRGSATLATTGTDSSRASPPCCACRWARVVLASIFLEGVMLFGALAFIPTHLNRAYGLPLTVAGSMLMLYGAGGMVFAALSSLLVRRLGEVGLAAGGGIVLLLALGDGRAGRAAPSSRRSRCLCAGLGFYMLHNTLQVNATQMAPAQRGSSVALFAASLFIGQSTGVALAGYRRRARRHRRRAPRLRASACFALALAFAAARRTARHARTRAGAAMG